VAHLPPRVNLRWKKGATENGAGLWQIWERIAALSGYKSAMRALVALVACGFLISCGGGGGSGGTGAGGQGGASGGGATSGGVSGLRIRVVNTFLPSGTTGPTVDIYDNSPTALTSSSKPIISGLAYGTVSAYVTPHYVAPNVTRVLMTALPAGSAPTDTTDAAQIWGTEDGSNAQVTVVLTADRNDIIGASPPPLTGMSFSGWVEKGGDPEDGMGPLAPAPPSGQGEFLASDSPIGATTVGAPPGYYLFIDDSCTPPLNGDPNQPGLPTIEAIDGEAPVSDFALFAAAAGSHAVSVVAWTGSDEPTCDQLTAKQGTTTQTVTAGQQILALVYGSSATDVHVVLASIAP
jgi:hypothetical protein